jgi:hypothetical protein
MSNVYFDSHPATDSSSRVCALLAAALLTCAACTTSPRSQSCADFNGTPEAIRTRVIGAEQLEEAFVVLDCVSRAGTHDVYEEACLVRADPKQKPEMGVEWERDLITFTPAVVADLAETHAIALATVFKKGPTGYMLFADDDLSESIMYRRFDPCAPEK